MTVHQPLPDLIPSWRRALRAANRSERTIDSYLLAANQLTEYLESQGLSLATTDVEADHIRGFLVQVLDTRASATARQRYASLKQLFKWLEEEGEILVDPMVRIKPPKVVEQPVPVLSNQDLAALIKACDGKRFVDRRDEAIVRLFIDTGMRLGELARLTVEGVDLDLEVAVVMGKGRRLRSVPFGKSTTRALDRYLRTRRAHEQADQPWLWLGLKRSTIRFGNRAYDRPTGRSCRIGKGEPTPVPSYIRPSLARRRRHRRRPAENRRVAVTPDARPLWSFSGRSAGS